MSDITHLIRLFDEDSGDEQWRKDMAVRVGMQIALLREERENFKKRAETAEAERDEARRQLAEARKVIESLYNAWEDAPLEITRRTDRMDAMINAQSMIWARSNDPH